MTEYGSISFDRTLWKTADQIHERLNAHEMGSSPALDLPVYWQSWEKVHRKLRVARDRGWHYSEKLLRENAWHVLGDLIRHAESNRRRFDVNARPPAVCSVTDIYHDLVATRVEFSVVNCNLAVQTVSAVTDPITLEGIALGAFEIRLSFHENRPEMTYEVFALDPNPAMKSDSITHPHVDSGALCEGEGRGAIKNALSQGRVLDFFLIVRQVLNTYNSASAYVELDRWYGASCPDCGVEAHDDDFCSCEDCATAVCGDCVRYCDVCGTSLCGECTVVCTSCNEWTCKPCRRNCTGCEQPVCKGCLDNEEDENGHVCATCVETRADAALDAPESPIDQPGPVLHTDGMGQIPVST